MYLPWPTWACRDSPNGALLRQGADNGFDALITLDAGIEFQRNLSSLPMAVVMLRADDNKLDSLIPLVPDLLNALSSLTPCTLVVVS